MARLTFVKKARENKKGRACRRCGKAIKKGDSYYWFANRIGRTGVRKEYCSEHRPRPSEMTTSDKLSTLYAAREELEDCAGWFDDDTTLEAAKALAEETLRNAIDNVNQVAEDYRESKSNMPDSLQEGTTGQQCEENADACDSWATEIESCADEIEALTEDDFADEDEESKRQSAIDLIKEKIEHVAGILGL